MTEASTPHFSVIVPSRDRPDRLGECLDSIFAGDYPDYEVVVVDNAPHRPGTRDLLARRYSNDERLRLVEEARRGIARSRAAGLAAARGELVAFVDDDVIVERRWLSAIASAFSAAANVAAVTTLILPRELETRPQFWTERFARYGKGQERRVLDAGGDELSDALHPYSPGVYGSGASMAFRTRVLRELGGIDPRLSTGGEDLDLFLKVIVAGYRLVYEPQAVVWHRHATDYESLRRLVFRYGAGLTALMTKWLFRDRSTAAEIARRLPAAARLALDQDSRKNAPKPSDYPAELTRLELAGMLAGPFLFARASLRERTGHAR